MGFIETKQMPNETKQMINKVYLVHQERLGIPPLIHDHRNNN